MNMPIKELTLRVVHAEHAFEHEQAFLLEYRVEREVDVEEERKVKMVEHLRDGIVKVKVERSHVNECVQNVARRVEDQK